MRKIIVLLSILFTTGCGEKNLSTIEYLPTSGETMTHIISSEELDMVQASLEIFPNEIYFGDTIYLTIHNENTSLETIRNFYQGPWMSMVSKDGTISSDLISKQYSWIAEYQHVVGSPSAAKFKDLLPSEKRLADSYFFEFPPLEDWNDPFWKELREKLPPEGIVCQFRVNFLYFTKVEGKMTPIWENRKMNVVHEVLIKPRPANEMALLAKWYQSTPEKLFPQDDGDRKVPNLDDYDLKSSGRSDIKIGWYKFDPWLFIRLGNRKPSDPNNPTTLDGWRKLEASLIPSMMRDEVRLTRLQLEYYSAKKGEASENAKNELVEWLQSLPEVQRTIMTTFLVSKMYDFFHTSLRDRNRELMRALYDMLDYGCQEAVCNFESINYKDHTLTPPQGVKVQRSFMEIVEPTVEDLALNSKELPDGFRIWDAVGDVGATRMVAQFVELKENDDTAVLRNREGLSFNLMFSALSEEDKQYAREQHKKKLAEEEVE